MHNNFYDVITKMPGFFARSYYCHTCKKAYSNYEKHLCPDACKCCGFRSACPEESWIVCNECHRSFKSQQCYDRHKELRGEARSVCQNLIKCTQCNRAVQPCYAAPEKHGCGMKKCWICGKFVKIEGHKCFIQPELKKRKKGDRFEGEEANGFFESECREDHNEDDDEPIEEPLTDLLFFDFDHPEIITENFDQDVSNYFGLIKCTLVPPRALFHPVLPYRTQGKLMFALCKACADTCNHTPCTHSDAERAIQGTWCTVELEKALEKGYRLLHIHEVWHFPQKTDTLFKEYIDTFAKIKLEASGYPKNCVTDEQKQAYVDDILEHQGIQLDPTKIVYNPGLRALAKLMLNSFWAKYVLHKDCLFFKKTYVLFSFQGSLHNEAI